jgi:hypothetical protein
MKYKDIKDKNVICPECRGKENVRYYCDAAQHNLGTNIPTYLIKCPMCDGGGSINVECLYDELSGGDEAAEAIVKWYKKGERK